MMEEEGIAKANHVGKRDVLSKRNVLVIYFLHLLSPAEARLKDKLF